MKIIPARNGQPTLEIDGRLVHSAYDPAREARREVEELSPRRPALVVILGLGLGYAVEAALELLPRARVIVLEAEEEIYRLAAKTRRLPQDARLTYVIGRNEAANFTAVTAAFDESAAAAFVYLTRLADLDPPFYHQAVAMIGRIAEMHLESLKSTASFGRLWWTNTVRNWRRLVALPDVGAWFGAGRDVPVFVFAAGPTLSEDLPLFAAGEGGVRLVVDTAWKTVRAAGVRIDAVFAIDAQETTLEHFSAEKPDRLIAVPIVPPALLAGIRHAMLMSFGGPFFDWFDRRLPRPLARLKSGGSVTTFAFELARKMYGNPIIFVGADFAYRAGRRYAAGTLYERQAEAAISRFAGMEELTRRRLAGRVRIEKNLATETNLLQYARWLGWEIKETTAEVLKTNSFGLLEAPVIDRGRLRALLAGPAPRLEWPPTRRSDEGPMLEALKAERDALDRALAAEPAALTRLSAFFDPLLRPAAVVSQREPLESEDMERLRERLREAREVLAEVTGEKRKTKAGGK